MKKRIYLALIILIAFLSIGFISASEVSINDTYAGQDSSMELLSVDNMGVGSDSNSLSINNADTNLNDNTIGASNETTKTAVVIDAPNIDLYYKNGTRFIATLSDINGNVLANESLVFEISGVNYTRITDSNGQASVAINLNPNTYDFNVYYAGSDEYIDTKTTSTCTVYPTISGEDIVKYYRNGTQYYAKFLNGDGSPLADTNVTFNINGVFYTRTTNASGVARLNINLHEGEYILTAIHPVTEFMYSNNITVLPTISGNDLTKVYRDNNQYYATFLGSDGSPLADTNITFNINGVFYTRTTNATGVARLNINLEPGTYIITAYNPNDDYAHSNIIEVIGSSATYIETHSYSFYADDNVTVNATLYNQLGYTIPGQEVTLIAGTTYTNYTDDNGVVTFTGIDLITGVHNVTYYYYGLDKYKSSETTNTITIRDQYDTVFDASDAIIYYHAGESFNVTVTDGYDVPIVGQPVYFTVNGKSYSRNTDENGTASLKINLRPGIYDILAKFNSTHYKEMSGLYEITVIDGNTSILDGQNITIGEGSGKSFDVTLKVGDIALPQRNVIFNINGVNYTRVTDDNGIAKININLNAGQYLIKYYYLGEDRISSASGESYVTVKARSATSLSWKSATSFVSDSDVNLQVLLVDSNNTPLSEREVVYSISSKDYAVTTDASGIAALTRSLSAGSYSVSYKYEGDDDYLPSEGSTTIAVTKSQTDSSGFGYWVFGRDMYNVDLATLSSKGTTDIFLNFYAFTTHGESAVLSWIKSANSYGINVHIWMQAFYDGSWINPVSGGSVNTAYFNEVINEAKYYAGLTGVAGVHMDYLRYPGNAYQTSGGAAAITEFVKQVTAACREVNPNIIMSAAVMPETTNNIYYYGQDIPAITRYLDVIVPMQYKGNYNAGTSWLASTTKWFVQNSNGAEVWSGLQSYVSDNDLTKLLATELTNDAQTCLDNGADGVILFRFGLSNFIDFSSLDTPSYGDEITVNDVLAAATDLKESIEANLELPSSVTVGDNTYTVPQFLAMMTQALLSLDGQVTSEIVAHIVTAPDNSTGDDIYVQFDTDQMLNVALAVYDYCILNNQAPNFMSTSMGDVKYETLVYLYARILAYYDANEALPSTALVNNFLDHPTLTVNMLPSYSTSEYSYQNYTTTWLNYCPVCDRYGTLLINPKGSVEGELTCYHCDSDFCGVTGHEKDSTSNYTLTRLSESVPVTPGKTGDEISLASVIDGAVYLKAYIEENEDTPEYIVLDEGKYTLQQFLYLMGYAILEINASSTEDIALEEISGGPSTPSGDVIDASLSKEDYMDVVLRVTNFIIDNNWIPNYASSTVGKIIYYELLDSFSRILNYYSENGDLPSSVKIVYSGVSSKSISDLSKSLIKGLSTERDKAVALYNYVRDYISYSFYYNTQKGAEGTLTSGSGNCCDQAQLLVAMARSVNMTVRFATGYCTFSSGSTYGHVWVQFLIGGSWINADPTSTRNSFGVINNWNTGSYTNRGTFDVLPY
ncbi:MAG: cysteine protease [Methanobrevibacter millerae]|uniref:Cysteine protease n=1 Tax=Methanobrevibacter millerae TaxID=230361 RepID=A0A8T3VQZ3_9EURY|nr:cysteine protease [Methanobrevibacter millerae]